MVNLYTLVPGWLVPAIAGVVSLHRIWRNDLRKSTFTPKYNKKLVAKLSVFRALVVAARRSCCRISSLPTRKELKWRISVGDTRGMKGRTMSTKVAVNDISCLTASGWLPYYSRSRRDLRNARQSWMLQHDMVMAGTANPNTNQMYPNVMRNSGCL